jgi:hypothetical protein
MTPRRCQTFDGHEPAMFLNIKTRTKVYYDGGQWFHMAENLFAQFSQVQATHQRLNSSVIVLNFDQGESTICWSML